MLASETPSAHGVEAVSLQAQREVTVSIRNPLTISKLRATNPHNLKSHIERALEQSQNEHIAHVKIMSSNQLKSGDLSLRAATTSETQGLRQFADDWVCRVGNEAYVRNPTYGVLAHGIRTKLQEQLSFESKRRRESSNYRPTIVNDKITADDWYMICHYVDLLKPLKDATLRLEGHLGKSNAGMWLVLPTYEQLMQQFEENKGRHSIRKSLAISLSYPVPSLLRNIICQRRSTSAGSSSINIPTV